MTSLTQISPPYPEELTFLNDEQHKILRLVYMPFRKEFYIYRNQTLKDTYKKFMKDYLQLMNDYIKSRLRRGVLADYIPHILTGDDYTLFVYREYEEEK
jgi:hypothetical protein